MSNDGMSVRIIYQCFKVVNADIKHKYTVSMAVIDIINYFFMLKY